tara:strand:- start:3700 stop:4170 length:471 start_codon:yes stop_codon:yes gene_type:complete
MNPNVYVLSTGFEQLYTTSWQHAISIVVGGKAEVIEEHPSVTIGCVDGPIPMPVKVRFKQGVFAGAFNRPRKPRKPTRKNLYIRDRGTCQYCGDKLTYENSTIDHVLPKSKGGEDKWENIVLACAPCNYQKGSKLLADSGLTLLNAGQARTKLMIN